MIAKKVTRWSKAYDDVKTLYTHAFPRLERIPFPFLFLRSKENWIDFLAFYEEDVFCGFVYLTSSLVHTNIAYLAVNKTLRSLGYGSAILQFVKERYPTHTIALEIERLDQSAPTYEQQKKRKNFYLRNGFQESGYCAYIYHVEYEILKSKQQFEKEQWKHLTKRLSFGTVSCKVYPTPSDTMK